MNRHPNHVLVIGAGLGGVNTVSALRRGGYTGRITLAGSETHPPYDRPPLSKQVLTGAWEPSRTTLFDDDALAAFDVELLLGRQVVGLTDRSATFADGTTVVADEIVVATGSRARTFPGQPDTVTTLRTLDDSIALRDRFESQPSVLIVGAGFIGTEIASAAVARGSSVTMVEAMTVPFARTLGEQVGTVCARLIRDNGVELRCGALLSELVDNGDAISAVLRDGDRIDAQVAVVGIGGVADVDWAASSSLVVDDGIRCDPFGRALGAEHIWAVGDASAWLDESTGRHTRSEHWNSTIAQARSVAASILGETPEPQPLPYFWSDQFGLKIQVFGHPNGSDTIEQLHGDGMFDGTVKGTVLGHFRSDRLVAVTAFGAPRLAVGYKAHIENGATISDIRDVAETH